MKVAINILPEHTFIGSLSLLIETGTHRISFIWFERKPFSVKGVLVYHAEDTITATDIRSMFTSVEGNLAGLSSVTVCYDFSESVLIPVQYAQEMVGEEAFSLIHGEDDDAVLNHDLITSAGIYNYYQIPKHVQAVFSQRFPAADIFHASSLQLEHLNREKNLVYCIIFSNTFKAILYHNEKLQIVQQFNYSTPEDVAYHLLNICEQFSASASAIDLRLMGMIEADSKLYQELSNYFSAIYFEQVPDAIFLREEIKQLPGQFISHLINLAQCVS